MTAVKIQKLEAVDLASLLKREAIDPKALTVVENVFEEVRTKGTSAVLDFTSRFDGVVFKNETDLRVTEKEITLAYSLLSEPELETIKDSILRVKKFCIAQKQNARDTIFQTDEGTTELRWLPIESVGIYVPSGRAPLPICAIMAAIPAKTAGVRRIILCAPPQNDGNIAPSILVSANECGINEIYKIGGAQAIAAMSYGVGTPKVDMICGPGNVYVAYAKQLASSLGLVKTDTIAGPSEVLILADETASPKIIASDMLAQAEHGPTSPAICVSLSESFASSLASELDLQVAALKNENPKNPVFSALENYGAIYVADSVDQAIQFANTFASEHLEIYTKDAENVAKQIRNAGSIFIRTGVVFGDYGKCGGNNILPTGRSARFASPLSVFPFLKQQQIEYLTEQAQCQLADLVSQFARLETLEAHSKSALARLEVVK